MDKLEYHLSPITDVSPITSVLSFGYPSPAYKDHRGLARIAVSGVVLGVLATSSLFGIYFFPSLWRVLLVTFFSSFYHLSEFLMTAYGHHDTVSYDSFLFHQSFEYSFARIVYHLEFFFWYFLCPSLRENQYSNTISILGVLGVVVGQTVRTLAMFQAAGSFTHIVATQHRQEHVLIKHGVYKYFRHPSYFGWFLWATSLQLLLFNPIFFIGTIFLAYSFFSDRIPYEEAVLIRFFGTEYIQYRDSTPTWIPFIR